MFVLMPQLNKAMSTDILKKIKRVLTLGLKFGDETQSIALGNIFISIVTTQ